MIAARTVVSAPIADGTHWGAVAGGIGGVATGAALLASLFLLAQTMRDRRQTRLDRHREHASNISFWMALSSATVTPDEVYGPEAPGVLLSIHIRNTSDRPAMKPLLLAGVRADVWRQANNADEEEHEELVKEWSEVALDPAGRWDFKLSEPAGIRSECSHVHRG
jgi:hypothetical protein